MRAIVNLVLITITVLTLGAAEEALLLKLPVHVFDNRKPMTDVDIDQFKLYINGQRRDIREVIKRNRDLDDTARARHFILLFNLTDPNQRLSDAIDHFVNTVLTAKDGVMVATTQKAYRIPPSANKVAMAERIREIMKKDSLQYRNNRQSARENLLNILRKVNRGSDIKSSVGRAGVSTGLTQNSIMEFLNNFSREWLDFKSKFLLPDLRIYAACAAPLATADGDKWLIHFQQRDIVPVLAEFRKAATAIRDYLSSLSGSQAVTAGSISSGLQTMEKSLLISEQYPSEHVLNIMLGSNIGYNLILFMNPRQQGGSIDQLSPDLEDVLRDIARRSGGTAVTTDDITEGVDRIATTRDVYYDLVFSFNGRKEEKTVRVEMSGDMKAVHKTRFYQQEIETLLDYMKNPGIQLEDVQLKGHRLSFTITGFKRKQDKPDKQGAMRVEIQLIDNEGTVRFNAENVLQSLKPSVSVSLNLPPDRSGYFKLQITARDLFSQKQHQVSRYVQL